MFKTVSLVLALLTLTAQTSPEPTKKPLKASAMVVFVRVANYTQTCAWVTIYWGRVHTPWIIEGGTNGRPRFVHPGQYFEFQVPFTNPLPTPLPAEIKVRAEFQNNPNCSGGTAPNGDKENYNKAIMASEGSFGFYAHVGSSLEGPPYRVSRPQ